MEIIREGPSASRPLVLDGKNYSYWKPRTIFFIKTLDGKSWRALVAGYDPPMITVNSVSVSKPEVDWTDTKEQASVGNAKALNATFNGTFKVKISRLQLITSKFEALRMTEDESVSDYNKRVLEIVRKVLRSLHRKFDMKVECPTFLRKQKKNFRATLSYEESGDSRDDDGNINAFTIQIADENIDDKSECYEENKNDKLSIEKLEALWKEDCEARAIQKERIQDLIEENEQLMSLISSLKIKLREVQNENDQILKSVKMLNLGAENLDSILNSEHNSSQRYGLGFVASASSLKATSEIKFVPASKVVEHETTHIETALGLQLNLLAERVTTVVEKTTDDAWYFDSGCSRHMTGNRSYFTNLKDFVTGHVTFVDGAKGRIMAKGNTVRNGMLGQNKESFSGALRIVGPIESSIADLGVL
ncbi:gag-pol polyprotein [Cucumis melo var. makuwa]|uniref:Gag-pol polyprotein n=1 Tax=Cucumis melo var. makuwa TaxID=1194695 RepID=A0A5D3E7C6_CUCMM|nr:gag-pol polyprotein [Cucumis melo var. makuwa]TYK31540.1 gag-pol polyprotein [Cucumis melo var. makuwa]